MKHLLFSSILLLSQMTSAQQDYTEIKEHFIRTCGSMDTLDVNKNVHFVDSVAKLNGLQNKEQFLMDYAWAYYRKYLYSAKHADLLVSINCYSQCWEEFGNTQALFSIASNYAGFNCVLSRNYLELYEQTLKHQAMELDEFNVSQIELIRKELCR